MRRRPEITFHRALAILGHHDRGWIDKLDKALGGTILAAGTGAALATVGAPALAPLGVLAALWGWIDQKNEAIGLLRSMTDQLSAKLAPARGIERRDLIAAAHSTIVAASFFEILEEAMGKKSVKKLAMTDEARRHLIAGRGKQVAQSSYEWLYSAEIPHPSSSCGFQENLTRLTEWNEGLAARTTGFLNLLAPNSTLVELDEAFLQKVLARYESRYLELASRVPEFLIWTMLGEHAAVRHKIKNLDDDIAKALASHGDALGRVEALLDLLTKKDAVVDDLRMVLHRANQGVLSRPIVPSDTERYDVQITFPTIGDIFVTPRYRIARMTSDSRPADEHWWSELKVFNDLDLMITGHLTAPESTRVPLLLLGHPGAGKSVLTKVLATQLPPADYTVVRVPLRNVGANAPILHQIQQALDLATNRRIEWHKLTDQSIDTVRVVLLDGLDELLQASRVDRSGYLQDVMEFQRIEGEQDKPVVVVVTSRTIVADRVDIPDGTALIKLDEFDNEQIAAWLKTWREANERGIQKGLVRELTVAEALQQSDLARQPLLLLMLALYAADPKSPALDKGLSTSALYERIFDNFARREVSKRAERPVSKKEADEDVRSQVFRLSIAALAMFNRGVQQVRESELQADLEAISSVRVDTLPDEQGKRLLGEFFFVYAPEATLLGAVADTDTAVEPTRQRKERSYEFLHATFGEYLVASLVVDVLRDVADGAFGGRREHDPDDELLYAILSHETLAIRRSIVSFASEICASMPHDERDRVQRTVSVLLGSYRQRHRSQKYIRYCPKLLDHVRQLAAYSSNLVTLAVIFAGQATGLPLEVFTANSKQAIQLWGSTVSLWRSGLDRDGWLAMLSLLNLRSDRRISLTETGDARLGITEGLAELLYARLIDDRDQAARERFGLALNDGRAFYDGRDWAEAMLSWIVPTIGGIPVSWFAEVPPGDTPRADIVAVGEALMMLLRVRSVDASDDAVSEVVKLVLGLPRVFALDAGAMLSLAYFHPGVFVRHRRLHSQNLYTEVQAELRFVLDSVSMRISGKLRAQWDRLRERLLRGSTVDLVDISQDGQVVQNLIRILSQAALLKSDRIGIVSRIRDASK